MTTVAPPAPAVFEKLAALSEQELAVVTAAFGRQPSVSELTPEDTARLDAMIDAAVAGMRAASAASEAAGIPMSPETPAEVEAPELPDEVPVTTANLRQRIRDLDDAARTAFLGVWGSTSLPQKLANDDGTDALLDRQAHLDLEALLARYEPPAGPETYEPLFATLAAAPPGVRFAVMGRVHAHGIANMANRTALTVGRVWALAKTLEDVQAEAATPLVEATLGPLPEPGRVVDTPVDSAEDLAEVPPSKGTIDDLLAWVNAGNVPARARRLLDLENAKAKPRKGLVSKLVPLAGESAAPPPAPPVAPPGAEVAPAVAAPAPGLFADPAPAQDADDLNGGDPHALSTPLSQFAAPADGGDSSGGPMPEPPVESPPSPAAGAVSAIPGQTTVDEQVAVELGEHELESALFRQVPVAEWGALMEAAYLRRLATELGVAADIVERHGLAAQAAFNAEHRA